MSKKLEVQQGFINAEQLLKMNNYINKVYEQEQRIINFEGKRHHKVQSQPVELLKEGQKNE